MTLLVVYAALALGISFLCSILEAVLLSVTPSYVAAREREGGVTGRTLRDLKEDVDRPLAAILSLNTIAHTVGAAGVGAQAVAVFGSAWIAAISAVLTLLILVLSEIIPKTLGAVHWRRLAPATARLLPVLMWTMWPLVLVSRGITRLLARDGTGAAIRREELTALADLGARAGVFREGESRILRNLFRFGDLTVRHIMTPRTVMVALEEAQTVGDVMAEHEEFRFSRLPVYRADPDDVTGYVLKDDILLRAARDEHGMPLRALRREILVLPESLPLPQVLERLLDRREHIALVMDEYGGTAGVVTMEDVLETVLGSEIVDEADSVQDMQELARRQWERRARRLGLIAEQEPAGPDDPPAH